MPVSRVSFCAMPFYDGKKTKLLWEKLSIAFQTFCLMSTEPRLLAVPRPSADYYSLLPDWYRTSPSCRRLTDRVCKNISFTNFWAPAEFFAAFWKPKSDIVNGKWPTSQSSTGVNFSALFILWFIALLFWQVVDNMSRQNIWTVNSSTLVRKPAKKQPADSNIYIDKRPTTLLSSA